MPLWIWLRHIEIEKLKMPKIKHGTHRYHRRALGSNKVWACAVPNCTHFIPRYMEAALIEGRLSLCNNCGNEFTLTPDALKEDEPRCDECRLGIKPIDDSVDLTNLMQSYLEEREK
jgi:hypothetical protein